MGCIACVGLLKDSEDELNAITLVLKKQSSISIEADSICPDLFAGRSQSEIEALPAFYGRRKVTLGDLFRVEADAAIPMARHPGDRSDHVVVRGYLQHVKHIGQGMSGGLITIHSDVGMHLGAKMSGGAIIVHGNADAWAGAHMSGGVIQVHGNAGAMLGAAYSGERRGMRGGIILVEGNVGPRAGERMRRGLIAVQGNVGEFAGARMIAGSLVVFGTLGARAGAGMKRGTIVALGGLADGLLPVFRYNCSYRPAFLRVYLRRLGEWGFPVTSEQIESVFHRYAGDITTLGKGEILVNDQH